MTTTVARHEDWGVAWDTESQSHTYLRDADVAFDEQGILSVGDRYEGSHHAFEQDFQSAPAVLSAVRAGTVRFRRTPSSIVSPKFRRTIAQRY